MKRKTLTAEAEMVTTDEPLLIGSVRNWESTLKVGGIVELVSAVCETGGGGAIESLENRHEKLLALTGKIIELMLRRGVISFDDASELLDLKRMELLGTGTREQFDLSGTEWADA